MDDLISRQVALEKVRAMQTYKLFKNDDMLLVDKAEVQTELMMLPSVQPEVLACGNGELVAQPELHEGHWKKDETDDCPPVFQQFRICSVCGAIETSETNYCPNCGVRMKGDSK